MDLARGVGILSAAREREFAVKPSHCSRASGMITTLAGGFKLRGNRRKGFSSAWSDPRVNRS
jgi:hypothetical protein